MIVQVYLMCRPLKSYFAKGRSHVDGLAAVDVELGALAHQHSGELRNNQPKRKRQLHPYCTLARAPLPITELTCASMILSTTLRTILGDTCMYTFIYFYYFFFVTVLGAFSKE